MCYDHAMMKLGVIGCGQMGRALLGGILRACVVREADVYLFNRTPEACSQIVREFPSVHVCGSIREMAALADMVILSVKPAGVCSALAELASAEGKKPCVLSIAAGVTLATMQSCAPELRMVRAMPNTPALVGMGAASFCGGSLATQDDLAAARRLLEAVGIAVELPEEKIHAVIGVAGSAPAYMFTILDAMADAGVSLGLTRGDALKLATQTMLGSARLVQESGRHPMELRDAVTSPGGTTIAALNAMDANNLRYAVIAGVREAARKSEEMSRGQS